MRRVRAFLLDKDNNIKLRSGILIQEQKTSEKGQPNGYAGLDSGGIIPIAQMASGTPDGTKFIRDDRTLQVPSSGGGGGGLYGNVVVNGNFDVWQLGTSFISAAHRQIVADRWVWGHTGGAVCNISQDTDTPSSEVQYSLKVEVTTADAVVDAGDISHVKYPIEGYDMKKLRGKTCTLSFWVKSSLIGIYCVAFTGAIDGTNVTQVKEFTVNVANTWEEKTITINFDYTSDVGWNYTNGQGLKVRFGLICGATYQTTKDAWNTGNFGGTSSQVNFMANVGNIIRLAKVQLNEGVTKKDYVFLPFSETLEKCRRYLQVISADVAGVTCGIGFAPSVDTCNFYLFTKVGMRVAPIVSAKGTIAVDYDAQAITGAYLGITALTSYERSKDVAILSVTKAAGFVAGNPYGFRLITTSGKLVFNSDFDLV